VPEYGAADKSESADHFDSRVAVSWFAFLYDLVRSERLSPPVASRAYAIASVALYEAIVPGMPLHRSLVGQLNELTSAPGAERHRKHHWPTVANAALARILSYRFADRPAALARIAALEAESASILGEAVPRRVSRRSAARGRVVADAIAGWAAADGFDELNNCPYSPPAGFGQWVPTPPGLRPALEPCWGQLRTLVLASADECPAVPPPPYSQDPASAFFADAFEVYQTVNALTDEQRAIALFWSDDPGRTGTPPGHWISIVNQIAVDEALTLDVAAEAYVRVGLAVADAFITRWRTKYEINLLRPVTFIRNLIDPSWLPLLVTPPFPEYTSGHSVQSGAAATLLGDLFGERPFTDRTHVDLGIAPLLSLLRGGCSGSGPLAPLRRDSLPLGHRERSGAGGLRGPHDLDRVQFRR
jgi:hypothetical protein